MFHKPVCVKCQVEMKVGKVGIWVLDKASFGDYKLTSADMHECPKCGYQIVTSFAEVSMHHHEEGFAELVEKIRANETSVLVEVN